MSEFAEGMEVSVLPGFENYPLSVKTIVRISGRKIVLDDGSEWSLKGRRWGSARDNWGDRIRPSQPSDRDIITRRRLTRFLTQEAIWSDVPLPALNRIANEVDSFRKKPE